MPGCAPASACRRLSAFAFEMDMGRLRRKFEELQKQLWAERQRFQDEYATMSTKNAQLATQLEESQNARVAFHMGHANKVAKMREKHEKEIQAFMTAEQEQVCAAGEREGKRGSRRWGTRSWGVARRRTASPSEQRPLRSVLVVAGVGFAAERIRCACGAVPPMDGHCGCRAWQSLPRCDGVQTRAPAHLVPRQPAPPPPHCDALRSLRPLSPTSSSGRGADTKCVHWGGTGFGAELL